MRQLNEAAELLIKSFESSDPENPPLKVYKDTGGVWTIGWGHTKDVTKTMPEITLEQAQQFFLYDISYAQREVERLVSVPLNDNQYGALVSLVFNCGSAPLQKTLGSKLRHGNYEAAADQFEFWVFDNGIRLRGLERRRKAERELFEKPMEG